MNDLLRWFSKAILSMILWVFILSIRWNDKPIYYYAHEFFVKNSLVQAVDAELAELWWRVVNKGDEVKEKAM